MSLSPPDWQRVSDMLAYARRARRHLAARQRADFDADELFQDALLRCLTVIGEAAYKVSPSGRAAYPEIPWAQIAAFRHVLVHEYGQVNLDRVWLIASTELAAIIVALEAVAATPPEV